MSLLGFDALGRLALGQLPTIGLTNTVLLAAPGPFAVAGAATSFSVMPFEAWTPSATPSEIWTAILEQSQIWTPTVIPSNPWTAE